MKKIITCLFSLFVLTSVISAETIGKRIFEIRTDVDATAGNNAFGISSFFQEEAVLDFPKIYKDLPKKGFITCFSAEPDVAVTLNIFDVKAGLEAGLDFSGSLGFSKDFFKFLGVGNKLNEPMSYTGNGNLDAFAYFRAPVRFKVQDITVSATPSIFVPMLHAEMVDTGVTITNESDGSIAVNASYSMLFQSGFETSVVESKAYTGAFGSVFGTSGFDMEVGVKVPVLFGLQVTGDVHVPIVPGKMNSIVTARGSVDYNMTLLSSGSDSETDSESVPETVPESDEPAEEPQLLEILYDSRVERINRPLTMMAGVEWNPLLDMVRINGALGYGIRYPFSKKAHFYPQYHAGATVSLLRILGVSFSTEYMNEMFRHEVGMMFNVRALEIDTAVSLIGADFKNSWSGKGFGANVTVCIGL